MIDNLLHQARRLDGLDPSSFETRFTRRAGTVSSRSTALERRFPGGARRDRSALNEIAAELPLLFPVHPGRGAPRGVPDPLRRPRDPALPLGFRESLYLWKDAVVVLTDSGGLQEETTALGVPCITLRENTERPITVELGTNVVAGCRKPAILAAYRNVAEGRARKGRVPPLWDGGRARGSGTCSRAPLAMSRATRFASRS